MSSDTPRWTLGGQVRPKVEVEMVADYGSIGTLYSLVEEFGEKTDEVYGDEGNVTLRVEVEASRVESMRLAVRDATNGKVEVRRVGLN